ncbi:Kelch repeat-containing protein [Shewanella frigidimarina]|uniref:Galactose oxidase n=1 Tax=Shewanella frigidimarina TaxID=56812 RepID=A0A106BXN8_SHEFR|nr:kelch repeat-containing protein [Shewanella frigidimarina]KVX00496.1 galactose oxidase [Shewanella frigidimarina]
MHNASLPSVMTSILSSLKGTSSVIQSFVLIGALCITTVDAAPLQNTSIAAIPQPVSNNAIALVHSNNKSYLLSFMGLAPEKNHLAVHNHAWALSLTDRSSQWQSIADVPHITPLAGRLASIAIGINDKAYVFGGYTVAENHDEVSTIDNYQYSIKTNQYTRIADMPVAVDDTTAAAYQQRYIYLFGGWHNDGNVNLVQVYDTQTNTWAQASPIPAPAVFGQAVGMVGNQLVLCDGVKVQANINARRSYQASPVCLFGEINPDNHLRIDWQLLPHYSVAANINASKSTITESSVNPSIANIAESNTAKSNTAATATAHYRMAATGIKTTTGGQIVFLGGSDNPYNYSGIGYNGEPSEPNAYSYRFDLATKQWLAPQTLSQPSMDHRGLVCWQGSLLRVGGMLKQQKVSSKVLLSTLAQDESCTQ